MRIERTMTHEMSPADVFAMVTSKEFQEQKCRDADALSWDVHISGDDSALEVRTKRKLPTVGFPSILRKIVPSGVTSTETVVWGPAGPDGSRTATLHVDFHGAPAKMNGTLDLHLKGPGSELVLETEFKATVPVIGGKIEKVAAPIIISVIDAEEQTGREWPNRAD